MASGEQVKALLKSYSEGDEPRFFAVAMQVAADEARKGHGKLAQDIRELIDEAKAKGSVRKTPGAPIPVVQPRGELAGLLTVGYPKLRLPDMILDASTMGKLNRVLLEQRQAGRLREHGLRPRRRLLLIGPPGTGKTMTAAALAGELQMPLFTILLDGLLTKYMGETAAKLRLIFDTIEKTKGVYLFDEFDAIGGKRTAQNDVGEIRRVLNSFLQFIEQEESEGLIVAATNHMELLDPALFRRFDDVIVYQLPGEDNAKDLIEDRLSMLDIKGVKWSEILTLTKGLSYSELMRACEDAAKEVVLTNKKKITTAQLSKCLKERRHAETTSESA
ncbi:MAG: ATP-binding protein [Cyanobacteria bacterium SZAS TMP-1]|nr:ATP-binding protein [Cyanobacteria bacterium SZAS TMP-1]